MSDKCNNDEIILYINVGLQFVYIFTRFVFDYYNHKKMNRIKHYNRTIIVKHEIMNERLEKLNNLIISKSKIDSKSDSIPEIQEHIYTSIDDKKINDNI